MSQINPNWDRWIFASVSNHFNTLAIAVPLPLFIEGQHRDTREIKDFFELRLDGPRMTEVSANNWQIRIEINCLVQSAMDETNYHRIRQNTGVVAAMFTGIGIFKYGDGLDDDQSQIGCMILLQDKRGRDFLEISHFGQIEPATKLLQSTVEGHYEMCQEGVL